MVMLAHPGSNRFIWYHVVGGPWRKDDYKRAIVANEKLNSWGITSTKFIWIIPASQIRRVKAAFKVVPLQHCQYWVVVFPPRLERKSLVAPGTNADFERQITCTHPESEWSALVMF